jgi:vitamin B12 transporter
MTGSIVGRAWSVSGAVFLLGTLLFGPASPVAGQWPGEIRGQVVDTRTGNGVAGVRVSLEGSSLSTLSTTDGHFELRPVPAGAVHLRVRRAGYLPREVTTEVQTGTVRSLRIDLEPAPVVLDGILVEGRLQRPSPHRIDHRTIRGSGALTLGGILESVPDLTVIRRGVGGEETITIRGAPPSGTLVLVDGTPLNDPVTGVADVGLIRADRITSVEVLPGARGARFGPGALGGVIVVRTDRSMTGVDLRGGAGALGRREGALSGVLPLGSILLESGVRYSEVDGSFDFTREPTIGGGEASRENADLRERGFRAALRPAPSRGGRNWEVTLDLHELERGIPGKSYAPSRHARQFLDRGHLGLRFERPISGPSSPAELRVRGGFEQRTLRSVDPAPPLGLPYDQHTRTDHGDVEVEVDGVLFWGDRVRGGGGVAARRVAIDSDLLESTEARIHHAGTFFHLDSSPLPLPLAPRLHGAVRVDRSHGGGATASHEIGVEARLRALHLHAAHRTAYKPPTPADQFFREGVGIEPNPDLKGERIPGEVEVGAYQQGTVGAFDLRGQASLFRGDIDDHIVWQPDFRFIWSPRNVDIRRRGGTAHLEIRHRSGLHLRGHWTRARVTYRRSGVDRPSSQLAYRPLHSGTVTLGWQGTPVRGEVTARYTGARYPVPAPVNELPGFWATDLTVSASHSLRGWTLEPTLRIDRLLGSRDPFIASIPEPGRSLRLHLGIVRSNQPQDRGVQP